MSIAETDVLETALVPAGPSTLVALAASSADILAAQSLYRQLVADLLTTDDYQVIQGEARKRKSGWRKLAHAFGISLEIVSVTHDRDDSGHIVRTEVVALATHPNGRSSDGLGACDVFEKCCRGATLCRKNHEHCRPECPGSIHFAHAQHDIPATAETRAKNRAISDLIGAGEVSAEELGDEGQGRRQSRPRSRQAARPTEDTGSEDGELATSAQLGAVAKLGKRLGIEPDALDAYLSELAGAPQSMETLTKRQASLQIDALQKLLR